MLQEFNKFCRRLWRDESGMVLAFTVVVFLTLFVIACTVYAVGEHIRQRIELQNAADAAAYSGAVVQADGLSRIAAINKAMAWTYVQMGRAEMDFAVDAWLEHILAPEVGKWQSNYFANLQLLLPYSPCAEDTFGFSWMGQRFGDSIAYYDSLLNGKIKINGTHAYRYQDIFNWWSHAPNHWPDLAKRIQMYRSMVRDMNRAEADIADENGAQSLKRNIEQTVLEVLRKNLGHPNSEDLWYACISTPPRAYLTILTNEEKLLKFLSPASDAKAAFDNGRDEWFLDTHAQDGIQRRYNQNHKNMLRAEWQWHLEGWQRTLGVCVGPIPLGDGKDTVRGVDAWQYAAFKDVYYETEKLKPLVLTGDYFKPFQHIVVSAAREMKNPLAFMFRPGAPGFFRFFEPERSGGKAQFAWAAATSRAGYRKKGGEVGEYWTMNTAEPDSGDGTWVGSRWNLSQWDWDAVLIPVHKTAGTQVADALWESVTPPPGEKLSDWWQLHAGGHKSGLGSFSGGPGPEGKMLH